MFFDLPMLLPSKPESFNASRVNLVIGACTILNPSKELPSKGLVYPKDHPLSAGQVEIKYMTAKEEDILTSQNLIKKGVVIEKLLNSLIVDKGVTANY